MLLLFKVKWIYAGCTNSSKIYTHTKLMITYGPQEVCWSACICRGSAIVLYFICIPQYFVVFGTFLGSTFGQWVCSHQSTVDWVWSWESIKTLLPGYIAVHTSVLCSWSVWCVCLVVCVAQPLPRSDTDLCVYNVLFHWSRREGKDLNLCSQTAMDKSCIVHL